MTADNSLGLTSSSSSVVEDLCQRYFNFTDEFHRNYVSNNRRFSLPEEEKKKLGIIQEIVIEDFKKASQRNNEVLDRSFNGMLKYLDNSTEKGLQAIELLWVANSNEQRQQTEQNYQSISNSVRSYIENSVKPIIDLLLMIKDKQDDVTKVCDQIMVCVNEEKKLFETYLKSAQQIETSTVEQIVKIYELVLKEEQLKFENNLKIKNQKSEEELKKLQADYDNKKAIMTTQADVVKTRIEKRSNERIKMYELLAPKCTIL